MSQTERRLAALVEAGVALSADLDLDSLLLRIADLAREVVGAGYAAVGVVGPNKELTRFVYSGIDEATAKKIGPLPVGRGVLGLLVDEARPLRLREMSEHPRSYGFPEHHPPMHSFLGVPVIVRGQVFGRLYMTEKEGAAEFSKDDERIALTLASQAGVAIENARLLDEVSSRGEEVAAAQRDIAVLEERERISKELHDGVIQSIYSVGLSLQGSISMLDRDPDMSRKRIDDAIAELDNVVRDVRAYIFELQPKSVQERGFTAAVEELVKDLEVNTLAHTDLALDEDACAQLEERATGHVVQIVREVLSNIARHAQATEVELSCSVVDGAVELRIDDNGIGFDPTSVARGHGLTNIESRAAKLGGSIAIVPLEPRGTRHILRVPRRTDG
jgi:signal transduction histidine kinase